MSAAAVVIIVIGLPLILMAIGFIILVTKVFGSGRGERGQTLEAARQLERTLTALETRLGAIEDIVLSSERKERQP